ncbi:MAG: hypothetical protein KDD21_01420 [Bacteroidetes bacterium]|nr:hypothetical protein [Bacteroidota bacterium]
MKTIKSINIIISILVTLIVISCKDDNIPTPNNGNKIPVCSIISPANNATFLTTDSIAVNIAASDSDGTIAKVEFYIDNVISSTKTDSPYTFLIAKGTLTQGSHNIKAIATDNKGATKSSTINLNINYVPTVYVAGYENNGHASIAKYWKNGTAVSLSDGTYSAAVNSIFLQGDDIYTAGYEYSGNLQLAKYWKNGTSNILGTDASSANSIVVKDNDVYVGGWEIVSGSDVPRYWSNGTGTTIKVNDPIISTVVLGNGQCTGIYLNGNNAYSVGYYRNSQGRFSPWETTNGFSPANTIPNNDKHSYANALFVSGSDKYVAGNQNSATTGLAMATIWKNGVATTLTDGNNSTGVATAVYVVGSDVYVAGWEQENYSGGGPQYAKYWKNGNEIKLSTVSSGATGIVVYGNDVYVSGWENNGAQNIAKYWKNGVSVNLTNGTYSASANCIIVK